MRRNEKNKMENELGLELTITSKAPDVDKAVADLLRPDKTLRDAVHGDIFVTKLERRLMDTKDYQRLRLIRQLGLTHLVYPGAEHSRFQHSLGTLHMSQQFINVILRNPYKDPTVPFYVTTPEFSLHSKDSTWESAIFTNYHILLTRICALLHDLAHVPFGHTLEREGNIFKGKDEWQDDKRVKHFLGEDMDTGQVIKEFLERTGLDWKEFLSDIRYILTTPHDEVERLQYPFVADILNNTICADLLDYVKRDLHHCGIRQTFDERFLTYFYLGMYNSKPRLLLRLAKPTTGVLRRDVLSETLNLLRLRYSLAEKAYYHRAKIAASAMIIAAVNSAFLNGKYLQKKMLYDMGDEELLLKLQKDGDPLEKHILDRLRRRSLYKAVYRISYKCWQHPIIDPGQRLVFDPPWLIYKG